MKSCNNCGNYTWFKNGTQMPEVCVECRFLDGGYGDPSNWKPQVITNADRIRAMSDEELADLIVGIMSRQRAMMLQRLSGELPNVSVVEMPMMAKAAHLKWLQQPADHFRDPTKMMGGVE